MPLTTCPECHTAMKVVARGEVFIDICPACRGVWLDGGELEKIMADTRRHEAERLADERIAEGRGPRPSVPREHHGDDRGERGRYDDDRGDRKRKKKKRGMFDLGDLGDVLDDLFD